MEIKDKRSKGQIPKGLNTHPTLVPEEQNTYSETTIQTYYRIQRGENVLDEHGQLQWEDHPTETETAYKIRYPDADGNITDEANHVYKAAFVGCTYHCG